MLRHLSLAKLMLAFAKEAQNHLHGRIALWRATRRLAYLVDRSRLLCCGRLALHPVCPVLQRFPKLVDSATLRFEC